MRLRTLTSAVWAPLNLWLAWRGDRWFLTWLAALGLAGSYEWLRLAQRLSLRWAGARWAARLGGLAYVLGLLLYWVRLRQAPAGRAWTVAALISVWSADTCAYLVGRSVGRHRLAPSISPGKTVEGTLGGMAATALLNAALAPHLGLAHPEGLLLGLAGAAAAAVGDLVESSAKRRAGVKDSGRLLPGHGGILDRIDGFVLVGGVYYHWRDWRARRQRQQHQP